MEISVKKGRKEQRNVWYSHPERDPDQIQRDVNPIHQNGSKNWNPELNPLNFSTKKIQRQ